MLGSARPFGRTAAAGPGVSRRYVALGFLRRFGFIPACPRLFRSSIGFGRGFVLPMRRPARVCLVAPRPLTSAVELAATGIRIRIRLPHRCVREFMVLPPLATIPAPHRPASSLAGHGSLVATAPGVGCATHFHRAKHRSARAPGLEDRSSGTAPSGGAESPWSPWSPRAVGDCDFSVPPNENCSRRVAASSWSCTNQGITYHRLVLMDGEATIPGDSGGPWFIATRAYGSTKGTCETGPLNQDMFSVADLYQEALGVQVKITP